jgi:hypothetical protein
LRNRQKELEMAASVGSHSSYFNRLTVGNSRCIVEVGDIVRIAAKQRKTHYGRIAAFEVKPALAPEEARFYGRAAVHYIREPQEVFGGQVEPQDVSVAAIDFNGDHHIVTNAELLAVRKEMPMKINMSLYQREGGEGFRINHDTLHFTVGEVYRGIGIQLMNSNNFPVIYRPQCYPTKYRVSMNIVDIRDLGTTQDPCEWDETESRFRPISSFPKEKGIIEGLFYCFWDVSVNKPGSFPLEVQVLDGTREVLKKTFVIKVCLASTIGYLRAQKLSVCHYMSAH